MSGQAVFEKNCQECHNGSVAKAPHKDMLSLMSPTMILKALTDGAMQEQATHLSVIEKKAVATFLTGRDPDTYTAVEQRKCAVNAAWFDYNQHPDTSGWGFDRKNTRYVDAATAGVDKNSIKTMKVKWVFPFPGAVRTRSQPLILGGAIYTGSADGRVYALDHDTGCIRWSFQAAAEVRTAIIPQDWTNDSQGMKENFPVIYFGDLTGTLYAVRADTGEEIWSDNPNDHPSVTITASPLYDDGVIYLALSSLEVTSAANPLYECCSFRGMLLAYNAKTGQELWRTETIQEPLIETGKTSVGTKIWGPSGAPIWSNLALDKRRGRIYAGTGENYSSPANGSSDAVFAFNIKTGDILWVQQKTAQDAWNVGCEVEDRSNCPEEDGPDFDFGAAIMLATTSDGKDLVIAGQKSGAVYALDPDDDGKEIWMRRVGKGGIQGGVHFGMARDGDNLFVPVSDFPDRHDWPWKWEEKPGMVALDLKTGQIKWRTLHDDKCLGRTFCTPGISAAATALDGMVIAGAMDGWLRVYDDETGHVIWEYDTARDYTDIAGSKAFGGSFGGSVGPIFHKGMMYVQSGYGIYLHMPGNVLIAFEVAK
ncbi:MAG: PQQ-binding-like beta-propeller repeat protein [Emcibacter sp.]|nr:PQQ-binding-like beta-propeller repeat protein [Emcibacter sp.]